MDICLKETAKFEFNKLRQAWSKDPSVAKYIAGKPETPTIPEGFSHYFEIYIKNRLVGDIKVFGNKMDAVRQKAQILMVLGEQRGKGIGTLALEQLLAKIQDMYQSVYCHVNRYNIASIKMLRKNGFRFSDFRGNEFILTKNFH